MTSPTTAADGVVIGAARALTRRRLFRRAGGVVLGGTLGVAFVGERTKPSLAQGQTACPSVALCSSTRRYGDGTCHHTLRSKRGGYLQYNCLFSNNYPQCWTEQHGCLWVCCDCCVDYNTGSGLCSSCGGAFYACICRRSYC
jgi:hypothetical protein